LGHAWRPLANRVGQGAKGGGSAESPQKAGGFRVKPDMSAEQAMRGIVRTAYQYLRANEAGVLESGNPKCVHQMRVAVRRLRSALRMFPQTKAYDLRSCCDTARLESLDESGRHRLRIRIKRARYAAEFFPDCTRTMQCERMWRRCPNCSIVREV